MSSESAIQKGKGIVANPEFFLTFFLAAIMGVAAIFTIGISGLWGWIMTGVVVALAATAHFTGLGQRFFVILMSIGGLIGGIVSFFAITLLWIAPEGGMQVFGETLSGHGQPAIAALLGLIMLGLAPAVIFGEKILPLFVALVAGAWGVLSVIIFVMVIIGVD